MAETPAGEISSSENRFSRFVRFVCRHPNLTGIVAAVAAAWAAAALYGDVPRPALGIVLLGAAVAGWRAGRGGTFRSFGAGMLFLPLLLSTVAVVSFRNPRPLVRMLCYDLAGMFFLSIPTWLTLLLLGVVLAAAFVVFLCTFDVAILIRRWYFAAAAMLLLFVEVMYGSVWSYQVIAAVFDRENAGSSLVAGAVWGAVILLLTLAWALFNLLAPRRRSWRNFAWCAGGFAVFSLFAWSATAVSFHWAAARAVAENPEAVDPRRPLPPELLARERELVPAGDRWCLELHKRGIELPVDGGGIWHGPNPISAEARRRTLDFAASPEGKAFFAANAERLKLYCRIAAEGRFEPVVSLPRLQGCRSVARRCAAQAALAYERGETAAILPPLEAAETLERSLYDHETATIEGLVRLAITSMRIAVIAGYGPETPEYAPRYRAMLERALAREAKVPSDVIESRALLTEVLRFENSGRIYPKGTSFYARLIAHPATCSKLLHWLRRAEEADRLAPEWRKSGTVPSLSEQPSAATGKALAVRALELTVLALKIYRCEHGAYPKTLDALVPGILRELPRDPSTGGPLHLAVSPEGIVMVSQVPDRGATYSQHPIFFVPRY